MTTYESLVVMIMFATLVVLVIKGK
ncbi:MULTISPECIES: putative holin-like toxin [Pelosinus]